MTLLPLSRPYIPSFKLKSIPKSNPKPYSLSQPLASIFSLNPIASLSNHNNSINDNKSLSPALAAAWQPPKYVYPDPIPEFALVVSASLHSFVLFLFGFLSIIFGANYTFYVLQETEKFRGELRKKLLKSKETFGDDIDAVVEVCAEVGW